MANPDEIRRALLAATQAYDEAVEAGDTATAAEIEPQARQLAQMYVNATSQPEERSGWDYDGSRTQQVVSGVNEGYYGSVLGAPVGIARASEGLSNLAKRGINAVAGTEIEPSTFWSDYEGPGSKEYAVDRMRDPESLYGRVMGAAASAPVPEDGPGWERRAGEMGGEGIAALTGIGRIGTPGRSAVTPPRGGAGGIATNVADTVADAVTSKYGGLAAGGKVVVGDAAAAAAAAGAGELAAENLGEEWRATGETVGGLGPSVVGATSRAGARAVGGAGDEGEAVLNAADRINVRASPGVVGNRFMAGVEGIAQALPFGPSTVVNRRQASQGQQLDEAFWRLNNQVRNQFDEAGNQVTDVPMANTPYSAGERVGDAISVTDPATGRKTGALPDLEERLGELTDAQFDAVGGRTGTVNIAPIVEELKPMGEGMIRTNRETLDDRVQQLLDARIPYDAELDAQLRKRLANEQRARKDTTEVNRMIEDNLSDEVRADVLDDWRGNIGPDIASRRAGLDSKAANAAYRGVRDAERNAATELGPDNLGNFDAAVAEKRRLVGDDPLAQGGEYEFLKNLASKEPEKIWNAVSSSDAVGRMEALKRTMPKEKFDVLVADILTSMARPKTIAAQASDVNSDTFDIGGFTKNWTNLDPKMKEALLPDPELRAQMEDVVKVGGGMVKRAKSQNTSNTAPILVGTGAANALATAPGTTIASSAALTGASAAFMTDAVSSIIARQYPGVSQGAARSSVRTGAQQVPSGEE